MMLSDWQLSKELTNWSHQAIKLFFMPILQARLGSAGAGVASQVSFPYPGYQVVIVNANKFKACWPKSDVPELSAEDVKHWERRFSITDTASLVEMPLVHVNDVTRIQKKWFGLVQSVFQDGGISFSNGRHRVAYLLTLGATDFPVIVDAIDSKLLMQYCGTEIRV